MALKPGHSREMTDEGDVCLLCEDVLQSLIWPHIETRDDENDEAWIFDVNVGSVVDLAATTDCMFCRFLVRLLGPRSRKHCHIPGGRVRVTESGMRKEWDISVEFHDGNGDQGDRYGFRLLADSASAVANGEAVYDLARPVDRSQCNPRFLKECYQDCKEHHGPRCGGLKSMLRSYNEKNKADLPHASGMRVIDVQGSCIVPAPPNCRYVALSYVWSTALSINLLKDNLYALAKPKGLKVETLSRTIADAMDVVAAIEERYLWVDALCIIQDDENDKTSQVYQMDKIYHGAAVTIVAAGGRNAGDGLPGVRQGSRLPECLHSVAVRGLQFQSDWPDSSSIINGSKWSSRGWTYQELMMSTCLLIFTEYQVFYSCETHCQAEDYVSHVIFDPDKDDPEDQRRSRRNRAPNAADNDLTTYECGVRDFTKRELSFESDRLNAMSGVLSMISEEHSEVFLCGLLVSTMFEHSMLWHPCGKARRRTTGGAAFPSWSWAASHSPVMYGVGENFGVHGYDYEETREIQKWSAIFPDGKQVSSSDLQRDKSTLEIQSCLLTFSTFSRRFNVSSCSHGTLWELADSYEHTACFQIKQDGIWVGSVVLSRDLAVDLLIDDTHEHEFLLLSKSPACQELFLPGWSDEEHLDEDGDPIALQLYDDQQLPFNQDELGGCNVMMVDRQDGVTYRLGVGQIHVDAWNLREPMLQQVILG